MKTRKILAVIFAIIMICSAVSPAFAATWDGEDYEFTVPEDLLLLTPTTPSDDPNWLLAGIGDPAGTLETYQAMSAVANFVSEGGDVNITVMQKGSEASRDIFNMSEATEAERVNVLADMTLTSDENVTVESGWTEQSEMPFFWIKIRGVSGDKVLSECLYGTIMNGYTVVFDTFVEGEVVPQETINIIEDMVESFHIKNLISKEEAREKAFQELIPPIIIFAVIAAMVIVTVIYMIIKWKKDKRLKGEIAEKLSAYRKSSAGRTEATGEARFVNSTEVTFAMIKRFAVYHSYIKNLPQIILGVVLSLAMILLTIIYQVEWWMILIVIGIVGYFIYKLIMSSMSTEKVQRGIYTRGSRAAAIYSFHSDEFSASGVFVPKLYPYFQITEVRTFENYIYLYYGSDNAYILDKDSFTTGTAEEFLRFIKKKLG